MKYYLIAGEASGDIHGANLIRSLSRVDKTAEFRFFGGDQMQEAGGGLVQHYRETALMGGWEVITNLGRVIKKLTLCRKDILKYNPDALILIDYSSFNLRIAKFAKQKGFRVFYYISPKVWAWRSSRVKTIRNFVDKLFVILPFEVEFYKKHDYEVEYVGNPLLDELVAKTKKKITPRAFIKEHGLPDKPIIALLAGSRKQEIELCLPEMLKVTDNYPDYQFVIAGVTMVPKEIYKKHIRGTDISIVFDQTYPLLMASEAAVVTSGTATLETALLNIPEMVIYKTSPVNYHTGKHIVNITYISLVNLIMQKEVVKEFIQFNIADKINDELKKLLEDKEYRNTMLQNYKTLKEKIGRPGASGRVAEMIFKTLN